MAFLKEGLDAKDGVFVGNQVGDANSAIAGAAKKLEAVYYSPYQNHACMEPMNCMAKVTADKCEVWVATQNGDGSLAAAAGASGLPPAKCEVYKYHLGGGFGRRGMQDYVTRAVQVAKQIPGVPVKLIWSREEDMRQGRFRPVGLCKLSAGLDDKGDLVGLSMRIAAPSILAYAAPSRLENGKDFIAFQGLNPQGAEGQFGYTVPNLLIEHAMRNTHVPPGFWRGVNTNQNAIWLECFMDELAKAAGKDPLEFRRKMMAKHPKHLAVLNAVADKIGWGTPPPAGVTRGIAQFMGYGSYVACAAEVRVSDRGRLKIDRLVLVDRLRPCRQPRPGRGPDRGLRRLRPRRRALPGVHAEGWPRRRGELRHLPDDADGGVPQDRDRGHALGRLLGRRRRAHHLRGRACRAQRHLRGDRQADPHAAPEEREPADLRCGGLDLSVLRRCFSQALLSECLRVGLRRRTPWRSKATRSRAR